MLAAWPAALSPARAHGCRAVMGSDAETPGAVRGILETSVTRVLTCCPLLQRCLFSTGHLQEERFTQRLDWDKDDLEALRAGGGL